MNTELNAILNGDEENNKKVIKTQVEKTISLLEELRIEFSHKMEDILIPVLKNKHDAIDVLLLDDVKPSDKLILVILRNRKEATIKQIMDLTGCNKQTCNSALNRLRNSGYVIKLRVSTYTLNETRIF